MAHNSRASLVLQKYSVTMKEKKIMVDIIQKLSQYHLSPIEEVTKKCDLETMLLRGN